MMDGLKCYCIGIGGASCTGKTTISRAVKEEILRKYPRQVKRVDILHQDDYYSVANECDLPFSQCGLYRDWDCHEALDLVRFHSDISAKKAELTNWLACNHSNDGVCILIVEGFLLFPTLQQETFDLSILLHIELQDLLQRRSMRIYPSTSTTTTNNNTEEFWTDPPGYVEEVVYRNYLKYHDRFLLDKLDDGSCVFQGMHIINSSLLSINDCINFILTLVDQS